jgi:hypothetical protein
MKTIVADFG